MSSSKTPESPPVTLRPASSPAASAFTHLRRVRRSQAPTSRFTWAQISGLPGSLPLQPAKLLASLTARPEFSSSHGDFYARASNGSVALPTAGYDYGGGWAPPPTGLSPAGTPTSLAAPQVSGPSSHTRRAQPPRRVWTPSPYIGGLTVAFRALEPLGTREDPVFGADTTRLACSQCLRIAAPVAGRRRKARFRVAGYTFSGGNCPRWTTNRISEAYRIASSLRTRISWSHRVPGPGHRPQRAAPAEAPRRLLPALPPLAMPPLPCHGLPSASACARARARVRRGGPRGRRPLPALRAARGLSRSGNSTELNLASGATTPR